MLDAEGQSPNLPLMEASVYTREYLVFLAALRKAREDAGLTQRELAQKLERSYSYVAKLETGYSRMDIYQIRCYLQAVGMPFLQFMQTYDQAFQEGEKAGLAGSD